MGFATGLRALGFAALAAVSTLAVAAPSVAAAATSSSVSTAAVRVVQIAELQRGKSYAYGAEGPSAFDCSGLVRYAYREAGVGSRLGGGHSGYAMLAWGRAHHLVSGSNPQVGDVVIYGSGAHAAIYIGGGRVISALNPSQGIRVTGLYALHLPVTGFVHTHLGASVTHRAKATTGAKATGAKATGAKATGAKATGTTGAKATGTTGAKAKATTGARYVRTTVYANLRTGASTSARVGAVVRPGVRLRVTGTVLATAKRWDRVEYLGHVYWVRADLVRAA